MELQKILCYNNVTKFRNYKYFIEYIQEGL